MLSTCTIKLWGFWIKVSYFCCGVCRGVVNCKFILALKKNDKSSHSVQRISNTLHISHLHTGSWYVARHIWTRSDWHSKIFVELLYLLLMHTLIHFHRVLFMKSSNSVHKVYKQTKIIDKGNSVQYAQRRDFNICWNLSSAPWLWAWYALDWEWLTFNYFNTSANILN